MIPGQTIRHYAIQRALGRGGQGEVYLAEDTLLQRPVAIKFATNAGSTLDRLLEEARSASQLDHVNIARVHEAGMTEDGRLFVVMEYVEGETLAAALKRGPLPVAQAREVVGQVLDALVEAHSRGIVHRDIKPSNVMLTAGGGVKVLDFGLAKRTANPLAAAAESTQTLTVEMTPPGLLVGTPAYMAPEQLLGRADFRSDLFACAVVLYECITGHRPFKGQGAELIGAILHQTPEPLSESTTPGSAELDAVLKHALEKKPEDRFQSAREMAAAVRTPSQIAKHAVRLRSGRFASRAIWAGILLPVILFSGWWLTRPEEMVPKPEAVRWYQQGLEALRDGTYYSATRAFEKLTESDPGFSLGHARLAEAWIHLDAPQKAQHELLLAKRGSSGWRRRAAMVERTVAAIEDLVLRDFRAAAEKYRRLLDLAPAESKAGVWLDLGRAQERATDYAAAMESYSQSIKLDPTHAAPWLLRGMVQGRRQQFAAMTADFQKAQSIFEASQNFEGQAEVAYQQGRLAIMAKNLAVARPSLARALDLAEKTGSEFHRVRTLMKLSVVTYLEGDASKAQELSTQAIARARGARMPLLTVLGLIELGNAQLSRLDLKAAEGTLREAVALAQSDHLPESEALSRMSLGSVFVQAGQDEQAIPEINAAMEFYSKGQARSEINAGRVLLGRVYRRRGEFVQVHRLLNEILREAEAAGDQGKATDVLGEIANAYAAQERFGEALDQFERRLERVKDSKAIPDIGYSLVGKARMLLELGALDQARATMEEVQQRAGTIEGVAQRLKSLQRDLLYRSGQWEACASAYAQTLRDKQDELQSAARQIECLAFARKMVEARHLSAAFERRAQEVKSRDAAWLRVACALVESEPAKAASSLDEAIGYFRKQEHLASLWMAESVAAAAFRRSGDASKAALHTQASVEALKKFEARCPEHLRQKYAVLPLVVHYQKMRT